MAQPPRRQNDFVQERDRLEGVAVAAVAATGTIMLGTVDTPFTVTKFELAAPGGYTQDATNYYVITLQKGATVLGTWSTLTGANGTIADATLVNATLAADPSGDTGDALKVVMTKTAAAANLPAGTRFIAHLRLL